MTCPAHKEDGICLRCQKKIGNLPPTPCPQRCLTSVGNSKLDLSMDTDIGNSVSVSPRRLLFPLPEEPLEDEPMPNFQDLKLHENTCGRKTPELTGLNLNLETSHYEEMPNPTGMRFGKLPKPEIWTESLQVFVYNIIAPCEQSAVTTLNQLLLNVKSMSLWDLRGLERVDVPGMKPHGLLTLRIQEPSFGTAIEINRMLSSMNFVAVSTSPIYLDGLIGTQYLWRSRDLPPHW